MLPPEVQRILGWIALFALAGTEVGTAQAWGRRRGPLNAPDEAAEQAFTFCRGVYQSVRREWLGTGWTTDFPDSDRNFMLRLSQLTSTPISRSADHEPFHAVVTLADDRLFLCPFLFLSDVGTIGLSDAEAENLREYLQKGGFLWVDDFWGDQAWAHWERELRRVLPAGDYPIQDVPVSHLMLQTLYHVDELPQVPSIQFWRRSGGHGTSERGSESAEPHIRAIFDGAGRPMVVMTHNTDIADGWEREGEDDAFFYRFSPRSYAVGINLVLFWMTH